MVSLFVVFVKIDKGKEDQQCYFFPENMSTFSHFENNGKCGCDDEYSGYKGNRIETRTMKTIQNDSHKGKRSEQIML